MFAAADKTVNNGVRQLRQAAWVATAVTSIALVLCGHGIAASPQVQPVQEFEVDSYAVSQDISVTAARRHLALQHKGTAIVEQLERSQGQAFAGVWFDNQSGKFVVPIVDEREIGGVKRLLAALGLADDYRLDPVSARWAELQDAQHHLNKELEPSIATNLVQTALDPHSNAVVVYEAEDAGRTLEEEISALVKRAPVPVRAEKVGVPRFQAEPHACKIYWAESTEENPAHRNCDRPLRGGVGIYAITSSGSYGNMCSMGFAARGIFLENPFMLTAGHCVQGWAHWGAEESERYFNYVGQFETGAFPGRDYAAVRVKQTTPTGDPNYWLGGSEGWQSRVVYWGGSQNIPIDYEAASYVGQQICRSGTRTGSDCGVVTQLNKTVNYPQGTVWGLTATDYSADQGDSGGSVWAGNTALGLHSGRDGTGSSLFQEVTEATDAMAVRVGTRLPSPPYAVTGSADPVGGREATLRGEVDPSATATTYRFEYGTTTAYGSSTSAASISGHNSTPVSQVAGGLTPDTLYHYRIVAENAAGVSYGKDETFHTETASPLAETQPATGRALKSATLRGRLEPGGLGASYQFEYGPTQSYGSTTLAQSFPASVGYWNVDEVVSGLKPEGHYNYRLKAWNSRGTGFGANQTFTTLANNWIFGSNTGSAGTSGGQFNRPLGMAADAPGGVPSGSVWVADKNNNRIQKFNAKGEFVMQFGGLGSGNGQLKEPVAIAVDSSGNLWVADRGNARVQKFSNSGVYLSQITQDLTYPSGVAVGDSGSIWVSDEGQGSVKSYNPTTKAKITEYEEFDVPANMATDPEGDIWIADALQHKIYEITSGSFTAAPRFGVFGSGPGQFNGPYAIAFKPSGNLLVSDRHNNRVQQFSPSGELLASFGTAGSASGQFCEPSGLAFSSRGVIFVSDACNNRLQRWTQKTLPEAVTQPASNVTSTGATLNARINPSGLSTTYRFEYGTTTAYGSSVPVPSASIAAGFDDINVSVPLSGLTYETTYHRRIVATNAEGTTYGRDRTFKTPATPSFASVFGSAGTGAGQFNRPLGLAADASSGSVWVADKNNNRIQKFNAKGEFVMQFGGLGSGNGQLKEPVAIAVDGAGNLWVADRGNARVQQFTSSGQYLGQITQDLTLPSGVAVGDSGSIWVSDEGQGSVKAYDPTTKAKITEYEEFDVPANMATDPEGDIWIADALQHKIYEITSGSFTAAPRFGVFGSGSGQLNGPFAIAFKPSGNLLVSDRHNHRIQQFSPSGEYQQQFGSAGSGVGQFAEPSGIALDAEGNAFVSDAANHRIHKWIFK